MSYSATPWTAVHLASLSFTIFQSLLKQISTESMMPSSHLIHYHPLLFLPSIFPTSGSFLNGPPFASGGQSIGASASASVLPMNIQGWFLLGLTGLISLLFKELSRIFSSTTFQRHQFFGAQHSLWSNSRPYMTTGNIIALTIWTFVSLTLGQKYFPRRQLVYFANFDLQEIVFIALPKPDTCKESEKEITINNLD